MEKPPNPRIRKTTEAVSLRYEPERNEAPRITAKGRGKIAERMIEVARAEGVPIKEDPDLVAALAQLDWYQEIPRELYQVVAEVLAFAYRLNRMAQGENAPR
jgi:flagellar biosynthesis protein